MNKSTIILSIFLCSIFILPFTAAQSSVYSDIHRIDILDLFISEQYLTCNTQLYAVLELKNSGEEDEYVHVELSNHQLHINEFSPITLIQSNDIHSITIPITLQEEPEGTYEFEIITYFGNEISRYFKSFTFHGCPEAPQPQPITIPETSPNPGPEASPTTYILSAQMLFIIIMVIIIFLLAVVYLAKNVQE